MPSRRQYDEVVADKLLSSHDGREDYTDCVAQSSMPKSLTKWKALGIGTSCLLAIYLMLNTIQYRASLQKGPELPYIYCDGSPSKRLFL